MRWICKSGDRAMTIPQVAALSARAVVSNRRPPGRAWLREAIGVDGRLRVQDHTDEVERWSQEAMEHAEGDRQVDAGSDFDSSVFTQKSR